MDEYRRHVALFRALAKIMIPPISLLFHLTHEDLRVDGPVLLIPNHSNAWDPLLVGTSLKNKHVYFVASEHLSRLGLVSRVLNWVIGPIPRRKASVGTDTVKACLRHFRAGHSVCLFAEGEQCWDGRTASVFPATGKLARASGATLVTFRVEGGYLSLPRWGRDIRRGKVHVHPVGIYPPEQLQKMTPKEINELIERDISEDAWARQRAHPVRYRSRRRAQGLERALYACPGCRCIGTLQTEGDRIFCRCGFSRSYTETGFFSPETPFASIAEWDQWQKKLLLERDFPRHGDLLFFDRDMELSRIQKDHSEELLAAGDLRQYSDRLVLGTWSFPLADIGTMAMVLSHLLLLNINGEYYQIRAKKDVNLRKYLEIWKEK